MVRTITSHSERAIAIEAGDFSSRLSSKANRAALLISIMSSGKYEPGKAPGLIANARELVEVIKDAAETRREPSRQTFRNLIPMETIQKIGGLDEMDSTADQLQRVLDEPIAQLDFEELKALGESLSQIAARSAVRAREVSKATIGV